MRYFAYDPSSDRFVPLAGPEFPDFGALISAREASGFAGGWVVEVVQDFGQGDTLSLTVSRPLAEALYLLAALMRAEDAVESGADLPEV